MTASVVALHERRRDLQQAVTSAQLRHPSGSTRAPYDPVIAFDALLALARRWDDLAETLDDAGIDPVATEMARGQVVAGLTPGVAPTLAALLMTDSLRPAVARLDAWKRGDLHADEVLDAWATGRRDEAVMGALLSEVDDAVFPLLTGRPLQERCPACTRACAAPHQQAGEGPDRLCLRHAVRAQ